MPRINLKWFDNAVGDCNIVMFADREPDPEAWWSAEPESIEALLAVVRAALAVDDKLIGIRYRGLSRYQCRFCKITAQSPAAIQHATDCVGAALRDALALFREDSDHA